MYNLIEDIEVGETQSASSFHRFVT